MFLTHGGSRWKRLSLVLNGLLIVHRGNRKYRVPTSQGGLMIKWLLPGGMSRKGSLLANSSGPLGTSLAWRTLFWAYVTTSHISLCWKCGPGSRTGIWQGLGRHLPLRFEFLRSQPTLPTQLPGMVYSPTVQIIHILEDSQTFFDNGSQK